MVILAFAVTLASQVVGIMLVLTLLIGPAAIAAQWSHRFWRGMSIRVVLAILIVWIGIFLAAFTNFPISFWISILTFGMYILSSIWR